MPRFYVNIEQHAVVEVVAPDWRAALVAAREWAAETEWCAGDVFDADSEDRDGRGDAVEPIARIGGERPTVTRPATFARALERVVWWHTDLAFRAPEQHPTAGQLIIRLKEELEAMRGGS